MKEYNLICGSSPKDFNDASNEMSAEGWEPAGEITSGDGWPFVQQWVRLNEESKAETQPILITGEWLEKVGFEHDGHYWVKDNLKLDSENRLIAFEPHGWGIIIARQVKYIHQLQNIYSALREKELKTQS